MENSVKLISSRIILEQNKTIDDYEDLICAICQEVSIDIQECEDCEKIYCQQCITDWKKKKDKCPYNCYPWKLKKPHKMVRNSISNLKFACKNSEQGCDQILQIINVIKHESSECQFLELNCSNNGCDQKYLKKDEKQHLEGCEFQLIDCQECQQKIQKNKVKEHNCIKEMIGIIHQLEQKIKDMYTQQQVQEIIDKNYVKKEEFEQFQVNTEQKIANLVNQIKDNIYENDNNKNQKQQQQQNIKEMPKNKNEQQENKKCPIGHELKIIKQEFNHFGLLLCNICLQNIKEINNFAYRCDICDFDKCTNCIQKPVKKIDYCNKGHMLQIVEPNTPEWKFIECDICEVQVVRSGVKSHQCLKCDFDRCHQCYLKGM